MYNSQKQADWAELSEELWGVVFCCLEKDMQNEDIPFCEDAARRFAAFLTLKG